MKKFLAVVLVLVFLVGCTATNCVEWKDMKVDPSAMYRGGEYLLTVTVTEVGMVGETAVATATMGDYTISLGQPFGHLLQVGHTYEVRATYLFVTSSGVPIFGLHQVVRDFPGATPQPTPNARSTPDGFSL